MACRSLLRRFFFLNNCEKESTTGGRWEFFRHHLPGKNIICQGSDEDDKQHHKNISDERILSTTSCSPTEEIVVDGGQINDHPSLIERETSTALYDVGSSEGLKRSVVDYVIVPQRKKKSICSADESCRVHDSRVQQNTHFLPTTKRDLSSDHQSNSTDENLMSLDEALKDERIELPLATLKEDKNKDLVGISVGQIGEEKKDNILTLLEDESEEHVPKVWPGILKPDPTGKVSQGQVNLDNLAIFKSDGDRKERERDFKRLVTAQRDFHYLEVVGDTHPCCVDKPKLLSVDKTDTFEDCITGVLKHFKTDKELLREKVYTLFTATLAVGWAMQLKIPPMFPGSPRYILIHHETKGYFQALWASYIVVEPQPSMTDGPFFAVIISEPLEYKTFEKSNITWNYRVIPSQRGKNLNTEIHDYLGMKFSLDATLTA